MGCQGGFFFLESFFAFAFFPDSSGFWEGRLPKKEGRQDAPFFRSYGLPMQEDVAIAHDHENKFPHWSTTPSRQQETPFGFP